MSDDRCPKCGSGKKEFRGIVRLPDYTHTCDDPWHTSAPAVAKPSEGSTPDHTSSGEGGFYCEKYEAKEDGRRIYDLHLVAYGATDEEARMNGLSLLRQPSVTPDPRKCVWCHGAKDNPQQIRTSNDQYIMCNNIMHHEASSPTTAEPSKEKK